MVNHAVSRSDLSIEGKTRAHYGRAFKLLFGHLRIYDGTGVERRIDTVDAHLARIIHLRLHDRRDVG